MTESNSSFVAGAPKPSLKDQLGQGGIVVAPGVYDALGALMAERAGFTVGYLSGASIAYTRFGRPDVGLVSMSEVATVLSAICERVALPIVVDADTGFGNAVNVMRTVRLFEQCGAEAIQLEDQTMPKRCGHLAGKSLVPTAEMVGKLKAALDTRRSARTLIIARTDAVAVEGFEPAIERAERYLEAGVDMLFIEALRNDNEMRAATQRFAGRAPLMANMVEGGQTPIKDATTLQQLGFRFVIFPGGLVRAFTRMAEQYFASLRQNGSTLPFAERMMDFDGMNRLLGTPDLLALGQRYDAAKFGGAA